MRQANDSQKQRQILLSLAYIGVRLRDLCSIINRFEVEDTHLEQLQQLAKEYYHANALLLPTSVNPTICTIGHVVAAHARQVHDKYGQGLLTVTMEGREGIALQMLSANTTYQHRWAEIFRYGFTGLDISARPLAQASVKSVGRVQITDHSPVWRVRFFIAKKLIKLQNKRCFLYSVLPRDL